MPLASVTARDTGRRRAGVLGKVSGVLDKCGGTLHFRASNRANLVRVFDNQCELFTVDPIVPGRQSPCLAFFFLFVDLQHCRANSSFICVDLDFCTI